MISLKEAQEKINEAILKQSFKNNPKELYEPIEYIMSIGGKRLRPAMTLLACNMFTDNIELAIKPALGLEIFHNFTLLHDDIMDQADLRRNQATVHKKWNQNIAILSGDAMCIKAYEYLIECKPEILPELLKTFNKTALQVCEGQQYDMNFERTDEVTVEDYLEMIELKTSVLLAASLKIGAIVGGANEHDAKELYRFGKSLGMAFQLQDDMLDVYGDTLYFGKKIGGDILANKKTFMLINALSMAKGDLSIELNYLLNAKDIDPEEKIKKVTNIYDNLGVRSLAEKKIEDFFNLAERSLEKVSVEFEKKNELRSVLEMLGKRVR